jgi:carbonic anhydrase
MSNEFATIPSLPSTIPIYGFIYDVKTGQLIEVPSATEVGRATVPAIASS